jgi:type I restriction enzyme, S subunit
VSPYKSKREDGLKVFLISHSDVDGRLDPLYYFSVNNLSIVNNTRYPVKKLSEVIEMQRGRFGHRPRNEPRFYGGEYPFIQTGDIVRASQSSGQINYSQTLNELGLKTSRLFSKPIVVITIAANIGDTAILDYPACFPDSLIGMTPKTNELTLEYINLYFKFIKTYLEDLAPQSAQKNINYQQLSPVPIVVPPLEIQQRTVQIYQAALIVRQQKEQQAQALLAGIDAYLLAELDIALPQYENTLEKRIFTTSLKEVSGDRLDAYFNYALKNSNIKTKYPTVSISSAFKSYSGGTPSKENLNYWKGDVPWVSPKDFKTLMLEDSEDHINEDAIKNSATTIAPEGSLLMVVRSGVLAHTIPVAITAKPMAFNQDVKAFISRADISTEFLASYIQVLNNQILPLIVKHSTTVQSINTVQLNKLKIPVLPRHLQNKIVRHIQTVRKEAQQVQIEAAQILVNAKTEVEQLILGE